MKKQTIFKMANGKQLTLCLSIGDMMALELEIGRSLFSVIAEIAGGSLRAMDLRYTIAALRRALPAPEEDDAIIQIIEEHCAAGGTLDDINQALLQTVFATGLFSRQKNDAVQEEDVMPKEK